MTPRPSCALKMRSLSTRVPKMTARRLASMLSKRGCQAAPASHEKMLAKGVFRFSVMNCGSMLRMPVPRAPDKVTPAKGPTRTVPRGMKAPPEVLFLSDGSRYSPRSR